MKKINQIPAPQKGVCGNSGKKNKVGQREKVHRIKSNLLYYNEEDYNMEEEC